MKTTLLRLSQRHIASALAGAGLLLLAPGLAAQAGGNAVAALNEDVQLLSRQVAQLRLEVESLRASNAELQRQVLTQRDVQTIVQNAAAAVKSEVRADTDKANAALRREIVDEVAKQIEALAKETNKQFALLTKGLQATPAVVANTPAATTTFSDDFPKTGIPYTVQPGDTLAGLATKYGSTVAWIRSANKIADPNRGLQAGAKIFIPQKAAAATP